MGALAFTPAPDLRAQTAPARLIPGDTVLATPRGRYDAGFLHRFLLGSHYRELWATPVEAPVLDLSTFAGGLTPVRRGGGQQTASLRLMGADGVEYAFRSIDKDAARTLDPELRRSLAARVLQDQVSALMPLSALVVSPLLDAAGVLYAEPMLFVMPDDPRLGEFREEFGGLLGFIEERPEEGPEDTPGFAGSSKIVASDRLFERLEENPLERIDGAVFLRARLLDVLVGDWDRHPDQWRWASFERDGLIVWEPIPRDRDWALSRLDGLLDRIAGFAWPHYVGFGDDYPSAFRLTWSGRALDRTLLAGVSRDTWDRVTGDLVSSLTNAVIHDAVRRLPDSYYTRIGAWLERALIDRRDRLPAMAADFYELLAGDVDVHTKDAAERIAVVRQPDGSVHVTVEAPVAAGATADVGPEFDRTFDPRETREVRLYLQGGDDRAVISGDGGPVRVRIIGGGGDDTLIDETGGVRDHFYDSRGDNRYTLAPGTELDERDWEEPTDPSSETHQAPARDWGARWLPVPAIRFEPDLGLFVGAGAIRWGYGFRYFPYRTRFAVSAGIGTTTLRPSVDATFDFPIIRPAVRGLLDASFSGAELNHFFGLGNETTAAGEDAFFEARRQSLELSAMIDLAVTPTIDVAAGPLVRFVRPYDNQATLLAQLQPYGAGNFDEAGIAGRLTAATADDPAAGARLVLNGRWFPELLDVRSTFGGIGMDAFAHATAELPFKPELRIHAGAEKLWGDYPYHDAAYIGGSSSLRGFQRQRFGGDASVFAASELRLALTDFYFLLPGTLGVLGLGDVGRVFLSGESSDRWHSAAGGGLWISFLNRTNALSVSLARSPERTAVYVNAGFSF